MEIIKNTAGMSFTRGWTKRNVVHHLLLALRMPCEGCYRISIVFVWMGENDSNALPVDAYFFTNEGKNLRFKTMRIHVDGDLNKLPLRLNGKGQIQVESKFIK